MNEAGFVSQHLQDHHDLETFRSGNSDLDDWLRRSARHAERMRSGRTWVWTREDLVVSYFTLAGHVIEREVLQLTLRSGSPDRIPAVLIARLALHQTLHGRGFGGALLAEASSRIVDATDIVAARFAVVDAIDAHAATFYAHYGFEPIPGTKRLVRKISDLAQDIGRR